MSDRLGEVAIVGYHLNAWNETPSHAQISGHAVQLEGFTSDEPATVILIGSDGRCITLLVIAPDASEHVARQELDSAAEPADGIGVDVTSEANRAASRSVSGVAARLAHHEGSGGDVERAAEIARWCEEAAQQFVNARTQAFVSILVEHIVRNRMTSPHAAR